MKSGKRSKGFIDGIIDGTIDGTIDEIGYIYICMLCLSSKILALVVLMLSSASAEALAFG